MAMQEDGEPTVWDVAWREGYTKAVESILGVPRKEAYRLASVFWRPPRTWRTRLARRLLQKAT